ncbi:peroxiredoxin-like family protein [Paenibacillus yanchengensis]|uniref:thioredoxin-dependent peroxiredoxin n=1 Tax=Paenibacillus yanchengensis TaxID=2035833 RepID=A0ABW4YJD3_9BACL
MNNAPLLPLHTELENATTQMEQMLTPEMVTMFDQSILQLRVSGIATALKVGTKAPDFSLKDQNGKTVTLYDYTAQGPVILLFYRGVWCPFCNITLRAYQQASELFEASGARILAISPQSPDYSTTMQTNNSITFPVLSDIGNKVASQYNILFELSESIRNVYRSIGISLDDYNGDSSWKLPVPTTYVIDRANIIRLTYAEADYKQRLEPSQVLDMLASL